jgi:cell division protein FtsL
MQGDKQKRDGEESWTKRFFPYFVLSEVLFLALLGIWGYYQIRGAQNEVKKIEEEIRELKRDNDMLKMEEKRMKDPFYVEKMAREKLGLARKNEVVYKIVPSPGD